MRFFRFMTPVAALTVLSIAVSVPIATPVTAQEVPTDLPEIVAEDVSVGQIVSFVNAMIAAERVRQEYLTKIEAADTEDEIDALVAEADKEGMAAVEQVRGITTAEYMAISLAARESEELTARITQRFELMRQAQGVTVTDQPAARPEGASETDSGTAAE
ncbi:MAG: DUF4168 domain-containing protein [Pseudomonadota bacterium]